MNFRGIMYEICSLLLILSFILINAKTVNAQILIQPEIGAITNINSGTDRIIEILHEEKYEEEQSLDTDNVSDKIIEKANQKNEIENQDVEVFYPYSNSKNENKPIYNIQKQKFEDGDISLKMENENKKNTNYTSEIKNDDLRKTKIVTAVSGGIQTVDTGNGGEVKNKISGVDIGFIRELKTTSGKLSIGGIIDYNHDSYDNKFRDIDGEGESNAFMVGIVAKQSKSNGLYYEGSARLGSAKTHLQSDYYTMNGIKTNIDFKKTTPVYAGHVKMGRIIKCDKKNDADIYGVYAFSHQDHMNLPLSSNEHYKLGSINSNRVKVGCRMTTKVSNGKIYYGLAYQYEGSEKIKARYNGDNVSAASGKGSSGLLELGYKISADKHKTLNIDLNASGFAGRQKGFTVQAQLIKSF